MDEAVQTQNITADVPTPPETPLEDQSTTQDHTHFKNQLRAFVHRNMMKCKNRRQFQDLIYTAANIKACYVLGNAMADSVDQPGGRNPFQRASGLGFQDLNNSNFDMQDLFEGL